MLDFSNIRIEIERLASEQMEADKIPPAQRLAFYRDELDRLNAPKKTKKTKAPKAVIAQLTQALATLPGVLERECSLSPKAAKRASAACDVARIRLNALV